jgi:hypothetical protein
VTSDLFILNPSACTRLFSRSFLRNTKFSFANGLLYEDVIASFQLLLRARAVVLVDEPFYFYRVGHSGQITARKDRKVLDILAVMELVVRELRMHRASAEVWARFIYFQNRIMLWLCAQVDAAYSTDLVRGAFKIGRSFPARSLEIFWQKFASDMGAQTGVCLQLYGNAGIYGDFARTGTLPEIAKDIVTSEAVRRFFLMRARLISRWLGRL